jgi:valyl-tRNA synthetase
MPRTVRVQAFEIIRTWLFYTLVKADLHTGELPWRDVMISGWGLNEQGKKISKRDLQKTSDPSGFNRYDPAQLIARYGADALRHWAARSALGQDLRYHEKHVRAGRRTVVKLWNAARLAWLGLEGFDPSAARIAVPARPPEDGALLHALDRVIETVDRGLEAYDYATGLRTLDRFFFEVFCDDWLESIKDRLYQPERFPAGSADAARATLFEALRALLGLYAPYLPFVTEALWQRMYRPHEGGPSLHTTRFPEPRGVAAVPGLEPLHELRAAVRAARTEARIPQSRPVVLTVTADAGRLERLRVLEASVRAGCRASHIEWRSGSELALTLDDQSG